MIHFFTSLALGSLLLLSLPFQAHSQLRIEWEKTIGGNKTDYLNNLIETPDGNYLLAGTSSSTPSFERTAAARGGKDYWIVKTDPGGNILWDKAYGGSGDDELQAVLSAPDGSLLLAGSSTSGVSGEKSSPSKGGADFWLVKIDASGALLWEQSYGGDADDRLQAITPAPGGGYLLAGYSASGISGDKSEASRGGTDFWVIHIDAGGQKVWDKTYGGNEDEQLTAVTATDDEGFLLGGTSSSGASGEKSEPSRGEWDFWVLRIDATGQILWDRTLGGESYENLQAVAAVEHGDFLVGGSSSSNASGEKSEDRISDASYNPDYWLLRLNGQGDILWDKTLGGNGYDQLTTIIAVGEGNFLIGGWTTSSSSIHKSENSQGVLDYWLLKIDENGRKLWDKGFGSIDPDYLTAVIAPSHGGYLLAGSSSGYASGDKSSERRNDSEDYWVVKVEEAAGSPPVYPRPQVMLEWDKAYEPTSDFNKGTIKAVVAAADGFLLGETTGSLAGLGTQYGIIKLDASGNKLWKKNYGGNHWEELGALVALPDGGFLLAGTSHSGISLDKTEENRSRGGAYDFGHMGPDYWVIRIDAEGNKLWDKTFGSRGDDYLSDAILTKDGGFLLGGASYVGGATADKTAEESGFWVVRIDEHGNKLWDNAFGGGSAGFKTLTEAADGSGFLLGGGISGHPEGRGAGDYWVVRIDEHGEEMWERNFGGNQLERLSALAPLPDGGFLIGGSSTSGASGDKSQENRGYSDFWVLRVDASGNVLWEKIFGGNYWDYLRDIVASRDGGFVLAGDSYSDISFEKTEERRGHNDFWVLKIDADGQTQWDKTVGGHEQEELVAIVEAQDGGYLLAGSSLSGRSAEKSEDPPGDSDYWVAKIKETSHGTLIGGGLFHSPAGAYFPDPFIEGRTHFSFAARSQERGRLHGMLHLTFLQAGLHFRSGELDWLAIAGGKAMATGTGTLNKTEGYRFIISAADKGRISPEEKDAFRLMIWAPDGRMVYDNQRSEPISVPASMMITAGNIHVRPLPGRPLAQKTTQHPHLRYKPEIKTVLEGFNVYPVPLSQEGIWLHFPEAMQDGKLQIRIFDMQGKTRALKTIDVEGKGEKHFWKLDHQDWPVGIYILTISGKQLFHQQKLMK